MSAQRLNRPRRSVAGRWFVVLLAVSLAAMLLPPRMTGHLANLLQVLVPFQDAVNGAADQLTDAVHGSGGDSAANDQPLTQAVQHTIATLAAENQALKDEYAALTRVRDRGLGRRGRLIPARVVADDTIGWRESKLLLGGRRRGVRRGDGVISRHFLVDASEEDGSAVGMAVLAAEVLVGVIERAGTHTSRVRLLSDTTTRMPVTVGRVEGTTFESSPAEFWLVGVGHGGLQVREVHHRYIDEGSVRVGDVVLTRDDDPILPPSITIGTVGKVSPDPQNGLLYTLDVDTGLDLQRIRRVYVVDTQR